MVDPRYLCHRANRGDSYRGCGVGRLDLTSFTPGSWGQEVRAERVSIEVVVRLCLEHAVDFGKGVSGTGRLALVWDLEQMCWTMPGRHRSWSFQRLDDSRPSEKGLTPRMKRELMELAIDLQDRVNGPVEWVTVASAIERRADIDLEKNTREYREAKERHRMHAAAIRSTGRGVSDLWEAMTWPHPDEEGATDGT